jgi:WD40 repeat protein
MASAAEEELTHLEELAALLQRRRRVLEIQHARFGDLVPASIVLELEDTERQLAQIHTDLRRLRPSPTDVHSPYLGLLTFQEDDSSFFFGRDALIGELLSKVEQSSFLAVLGPSGSGKSSVVRAGLIPALKRGALPGSEMWHFLTPLKPGARPLNALAATLATAQAGRLGDIAAIHQTLSKKPDALLLIADGLLSGQTNPRLVLVVDQAEELWTLAPIEPAARTAFLTDQQQPFINCLLAAARAADHPVLIILTMRADFLHRALEHQELASWTKTYNVLVEPLTRDELHSAIIRPAELVGSGFEPGLVDTLVEQTVSQPGALPLLEYTLLELWKERQPDGTLTWDAFKAIGGGVEGGLARRADTVLAQQYTSEQQAELRAVLLRLVQPGEGAVDTRRRVPLEDLVPAGSSSETVQALLKPLADERLITTSYNPESDEDIVEVSHEALIRAWPTLGRWITTARGDLRLQIQLGEAARDWVSSGENPDLLWSGLRLANTEAWLGRTRPRLNARDQRFIEASRAQRQAQIEAEQARVAAEEAARQRELNQARALADEQHRRAEAERQRAEEQAVATMRLRRRAVFLAGALFVALVAGVAASVFGVRADRSSRLSQARYLAAQGQNVFAERPLLGLRLVVEGLELVPPDEQIARTTLMSVTEQLAGQGRLLHLASDVQQITAAPNAAVFVLHRDGQPCELRRISDGALVTILDTNGRCDTSFSSDSAYLTVGSVDEQGVYGGDVTLRRAMDGTIVLNMRQVLHVEFSPNSEVFVVSYQLSATPAELRRSADGMLVAQLAAESEGARFSTDGSVFAITRGERSIEIRRTVDGALVTPLTGSISAFELSPNGRFIVVGYQDSATPAELRRTADGTLVTKLSGTISDVTHRSHLVAVTFSPDSAVFLVGYQDSATPAELRRTVDGTLVTKLRRALGEFDTVSFSSNSNAFVVRHLNFFAELLRVDGHNGPLPSDTGVVEFSPDGQVFVVSPWNDQTPAELRHTEDGALVAQLTAEGGGATFSPDGSAFIVAYPIYLPIPGELRRTADGALLAKLTSVLRGSDNVTFSPKGRVFTVYYKNGRSEVWDWRPVGRRLATLGLGVTETAVSSDDQHMVVRYSTGDVYLLDLNWLRAMNGNSAAHSVEELVRVACTGPFASSFWTDIDQQMLDTTLAEWGARACK